MPRAGLSAERVVERAAQIVDVDGLEALSLSRLAADLGVAPPSLYKHVAGMSNLVQQVSMQGGGGCSEGGESENDAVVESASYPVEWAD